MFDNVFFLNFYHLTTLAKKKRKKSDVCYGLLVGSITFSSLPQNHEDVSLHLVNLFLSILSGKKIISSNAFKISLVLLKINIIHWHLSVKIFISLNKSTEIIVLHSVKAAEFNRNCVSKQNW